MVNYTLATKREKPKEMLNRLFRKVTRRCHVDNLCWSELAADHGALHHSTFNVANEIMEDKWRAKRPENRNGKVELDKLKVTFCYVISIENVIIRCMRTLRLSTTPVMSNQQSAYTGCCHGIAPTFVPALTLRFVSFLYH